MPIVAAQQTASPGEEALVPGLWSVTDLLPAEVASSPHRGIGSAVVLAQTP